MISKESAQEQLKKSHHAGHQKEQLSRLQRLNNATSKAGQILIQAGPHWEKLKKESKTRYPIQSRPQETIGELNPANRQALFNALFPGTALFVEETWNLFDRLPYQSSYTRRPFRNPSQKLVQARMAWLQRFAHLTAGYQHQNVQWFAAWAPHLRSYYATDALGYLFAAAVDKGGTTGEEVFNILRSSAYGTHETGAMGRHVVRGLLCSSRVEGWNVIEKMLLAAQREEGLRQTVLEAIDEAHPQAFPRMLQLVIEHNLIRFSATTRAFGVWFGLPFDQITPKMNNSLLSQVLNFLTSLADIQKTFVSGTPQDIYYALWAQAFDNVMHALPHARKLADSPDVEKRFVAAHFLSQTSLKEALPTLLNMVNDEDLRVSSRALMNLTRWEFEGELLPQSDLFERIERLLPRIYNKQNNLKPLVWDWLPLSIDREAVTGKLIECIGTRSPKRLIPHLPLMRAGDRERVANLLANAKNKDEEILQVLLLLVGDASPGVREDALKGLNNFTLKESDVIKLEQLLSRQAEDLRRGIIQLLLGLPDKKLLESTGRLIQYKDEKQQLAALEIFSECKQKNRLWDQIQPQVMQYKQRGSLSESENRMLNDLLAESVETYSLNDALGLMNPKNRTKPAPISIGGIKRLYSKTKLVTASALECIKSLDLLIEEHRNDVIEIERGKTKTTELLGNIHWASQLISNRPGQENKQSDFPLKEIAETWQRNRTKTTRDQDGFELLRARVAMELLGPHYPDFMHAFMPHDGKTIPRELQTHYGFNSSLNMKYPQIIEALIDWLIRTYPVKGETEFILSALEDSVTRIPNSELTGLKEEYGRKARSLSHKKLVYLETARWQRDFRLDTWTNEHHARLWKLVCWLNEPKPNLPGDYAQLDDLLYAFESGAATRDDLYYMILGAEKRERNYYGGPLTQFSGRKRYKHEALKYDRFPILTEVIDACRERILEVECKRGELPTAATRPAMSLRSVPGVKNLFRMLSALGKSTFARGYVYGTGRSGVFSHLIRNSYPLKKDTFKDFTKSAKDAHIPEARLIELAVYAPQWVDFVQYTTGWEHLSEAVWWLYAHTKDRQWSVEQAMRDEWKILIAEHTPLTADDLMDGAVDVAWFKRVYEGVGEKRWGQLYEAALYTAGGIGHARARLYSDAMLGKVTAEEVIARITRKRHQDSVRALGLLPLGKMKDQKREILRRYEVMQEFIRTGKKFGSQRRASERLAVSIGMQNLARTAGYADPQRLEWAMEIEAVKDLAAGPIQIQAGEYQLTLDLNGLGEPVLETTKKGRAVKTIPSATRTNEKISALLERKQKLDRQVSRMRLSLEQAMCRGDSFTAAELKELFRHPMLRSMMGQLVFVSSQGMGYPIRSASKLYTHKGKEIALKNTDMVRIAHPLDFLAGREWHLWQRECFTTKRTQPFKQVFREVYVPTSAEKRDHGLSRRYDGQQINPRQAAALFGARGWVIDPNAGVNKTFHDTGISARVEFLQGFFTPAEVEGLTIEGVSFVKRGEFSALKWKDLPVHIFSEVMRDLDLVVSVAHAGGIDPESSASSIEARTALIRETCRLLNIKNVHLNKTHGMIDGKLANYNVNLGSGVVHKQPGGSLCIIPIHSQQRGRLFLPFADNDPKTAEIISKVILLARDDQIKDPTILEQIL